jgi:Ser/Thr protein kinase RdoA (MazF antagonist)
VLCDGDRLAILDLDDAAMSEPLVDVANFRAHLMLLGAQRRGDVAALADVSGAFVDRSLQFDPAFDERLLAFLTATTLLRLSGIHVSRKNGPAVARLLIEAANRTLV